MTAFIILALSFFFMLLVCCYYYGASEYYRYKTARMLAEGLGGRAVFAINRSYMRGDCDGVEERVWIAPDNNMVLGRTPSLLRPPEGKLFLRRGRGFGFRFQIEPKAGILSRSIALDGLKDANFDVPELDTRLRLRTDNHPEAAPYFSAPEKQQSLIALFLAGFTQLKGDHNAIVATRKGISAKDVNLEKIALSFGHLRSL